MNKQSLLKTKTVLRISQKESIQNLSSLLFPGIFFLPLATAAFFRKAPLVLGPVLSIAALIAAAVLAIVYGLQGFARESDKKTLDFVLSRPISLPVLVGVKIFFCTGIFVIWLMLFHSVIQLDLSAIPGSTKLDISWLGVILIMLNSMGFIAGLLTRGAERLAVTVLLTGLLAGLSYGIWSYCFELMVAHYYWFDIPPHIYFLVERVIPWVLLLISLWIPWVMVLWFLQGKPKPFRFIPFRRVTVLWCIFLLVTYIANLTLGPAVWPTAVENHEGDWHLRAGVVLTGASLSTHGRPAATFLNIARIGGKVRLIYKGTQIRTPRWSPDGTTIAFVDNDRLKLYHRGQITSLVPGDTPAWSSDGRQLAYSSLEKDGSKQQQIYTLDRTTGETTLLWNITPGLLELLWDSDNDFLYGVHRDGNFYIIDLEEQKVQTIKVPSEILLVMKNPRLIRCSSKEILLSLAGEHEVKIYAYKPEHDQLTLKETRVGRELATVTQALISPDGKGFLWPRIDGAFEYQGIIPPHHHHHHHVGHEDCSHTH